MKIENKILTVNKYSRPGTKLSKVKGIVVHYVGNPGSSAAANRNYFENLKNQSKVFASSHYIVGLDGEVIRCIPDDEMAYHVGAKTYKPAAVKSLGDYPNGTTIGVECCHPDSTGKPKAATRESVVQLCRDLCKAHGLNPAKDLYIHWDITGKDCHRYYVANPKEWEQFKKDVAAKEVDQVHIDNVNVLVKAGIIGSPEVWYNLEKVHVENVKALISKMAAKMK